MEVMEKPVYVDVNEVCADWGVYQSYLLRRSMYEEVTDDEV